MSRRSNACMLTLLFVFFLLSGCNKLDDFWDHHPGKPDQPTSYSSEVIEKWMAMQIRLMKNATGIPNHGFSRHYAYTGIAALEAIAPGMPAYGQWNKKWNGLSGLPYAGHTKKYYWPANVNAALAGMNKAMFPNANNIDKAAIDSLENALNEVFLTKIGASRLSVSAQFGKDVANAVYNWAETDGYKNANNAYTPPVGDGLWKPTAPAFANAATPYWGNNRLIIKGSTLQSQPPAPPAYSTDANSPFFKMAKQVYDASLTLTADQTAMAIFWRDVPGVSSPGHWLSILQQTVHQTNPSLAKAALAYALTGTAINDGLIGCFQIKYQYNLVRPITFIRESMGYATWNSLLGTPAHPECPSAHSALSAGAAYMFEKIFGKPSSFTDHTYDYLGFGPRTYTSFTAIAKEAGQSRLYAGIHYQFSIDAGLSQGRKIGENIYNQCVPSNFDLK